MSEAAGVDMHAWFDRFVGGTEELPFAESLAKVGLTLTVSGDGAAREFKVAEAPDATPEQIAHRTRWLAHNDLITRR